MQIVKRDLIARRTFQKGIPRQRSSGRKKKKNIYIYIYIYIVPKKLQEFSKDWRAKEICGYGVNLNILWQYKTVLPGEIYMYIEV